MTSSLGKNASIEVGSFQRGSHIPKQGFGGREGTREGLLAMTRPRKPFVNPASFQNPLSKGPAKNNCGNTAHLKSGPSLDPPDPDEVAQDREDMEDKDKPKDNGVIEWGWPIGAMHCPNYWADLGPSGPQNFRVPGKRGKGCAPKLLRPLRRLLDTHACGLRRHANR